MTNAVAEKPAKERGLTTLDPFRLLDRWTDMERLLLRNFHPFFAGFRQATTGEWVPSIDVFKKADALVVKADLPGMRKEDLRVTVEEGDLLIQGERKEEKEVKDEDFYRLERCSGTFFRRLPLGFDADPEKIDAKFKDGVLEIRVPTPREAPAKARKVTVR